MYQIDLYNKDEKLVGSFYINPAAVASIYHNVASNQVSGRLNNGQAFEIPADKLEEFKELVDKASGSGKTEHHLSALPKPPIDSDGDDGKMFQNLAATNENLAYIWLHTRDGRKIKLTKEELEGKVN